MKGLRITYIIDNPEMSDAEFEDQEEKTFYISENELRELVERKLPLKKMDSVDWGYSHIEYLTK